MLLNIVKQIAAKEATMIDFSNPELLESLFTDNEDEGFDHPQGESETDEHGNEYSLCESANHWTDIYDK
jgi:hypothetical protein